MLTPREAFKVAFLQRCAEAGMSMEETHAEVKEAIATVETLEKQAVGLNDTLRNWVPGYGILSDVATDVGKGLTDTGLKSVGLAAALAPPALGAAGGYMAAKATGLNDEDADEFKTREKIEEYRRAAEQARVQQLLRMRQMQRRRPTRSLI